MSTEMRPEQGIAGKFVRSALDENGVLSKIEFTNSENFNFAYDVMDALAEKEPDQTALIYVSKDRTIEKKFTFQDIKDYSNRAANYFKSLGIRKGDKVMLVLKRHYQYWFTMMALHKIGAIAIPATNILKATDYQYRIEAAGVSAVVCTPGLLFFSYSFLFAISTASFRYSSYASISAIFVNPFFCPYHIWL